MTKRSPADARALWRALVHNAVGLVLDAHALYPTSPARAQALVVLAQEELGEAAGVFDACWKRWKSGSEEPVTISRLVDHGRSHVEKFATADEESDIIRHVWTVPPDEELGKLTPISDHEAQKRYRDFAREANSDKQNGLYLDLRPDGTISVPDEIDRPYLADEIVIAAQLCMQAMGLDAMCADAGVDCALDMA